MSDILIKGMEMPQNCDDCHFDIDCPYDESQDSYKMMSGRPLKCPLIPVPPHGRLIDADALKAKQQEDADLFINAVSLAEKSRRDEALNAVANIVNAPTIIPAEE